MPSLRQAPWVLLVLLCILLVACTGSRRARERGRTDGAVASEAGVLLDGSLPTDGDPADSGDRLDGGVDAGSDASHDAGLDGGHDSGLDAGNDAGHDAGWDAGHDAGWDAGHDAGWDAGCWPIEDQAHGVTRTNGGFSPDYFGQSFTPSISGDLVRIDVDVTNTHDATVGILEVYGGGVCSIDPCGALIDSEGFDIAAGPNTFELTDPIAVIAGREYTFRLYTGMGISAPLDNMNGYGRGRALSHTSHDLVFATYISTCD